MKVHHFDIEEAEKYGLREAIILYNIRFWLEKNIANGTNFKNGRVWTFNSYKAFNELFPYLSQSQIKRCLTNLVKGGILIKENHNKLGFDRTNWYSINEAKYAFNEYSSPLDKSVPRADEIVPRVDVSVPAIPDNKTNIKNTYTNYIRWVELWNQLHGTSLRLTKEKEKQIRARLNQYTPDEIAIALRNRLDDAWLNTDGKEYLPNWNAFWRNDEKVERYLNQQDEEDIF
jgi:hypothetical protein